MKKSTLTMILVTLICFSCSKSSDSDPIEFDFVVVSKEDDSVQISDISANQSVTFIADCGVVNNIIYHEDLNAFGYLACGSIDDFELRNAETGDLISATKGGDFSVITIDEDNGRLMGISSKLNQGQFITVFTIIDLNSNTIINSFDLEHYNGQAPGSGFYNPSNDSFNFISTQRLISLNVQTGAEIFRAPLSYVSNNTEFDPASNKYIMLSFDSDEDKSVLVTVDATNGSEIAEVDVTPDLRFAFRVAAYDPESNLFHTINSLSEIISINVSDGRVVNRIPIEITGFPILLFDK